MESRGWSVEVEGLSLAYSQQSVLERVSLTVEPGQFVALMGPSGSGKTSMLSCIAGLVRPQRGSVHVGPHEVSAMSRRKAAAMRGANMGQMFQQPELLPELTVAENVAALEIFRGTSRARALAEASDRLEEVGLGGFELRSTSELSGGEAQRVALARALNNPQMRLLLADEPTASLDHRTAEAVVDCLARAVRAHGVTTIVCTHDPMVAAACDSLVELSQLAKVA